MSSFGILDPAVIGNPLDLKGKSPMELVTGATGIPEVANDQMQYIGMSCCVFKHMFEFHPNLHNISRYRGALQSSSGW